MPVTETFDEACLALADFLRREYQPCDGLLWLCREEVTGWRRRIFVHPSPLASNHDNYRRHYEFGARQGRGMRIFVPFFLDHRACCYVWVPRDEIDASYAMLSDPVRDTEFPITATQCSTAAEFHFRRVWFRLRGESAGLQEFPSRRDLHHNTRNA